MRPLGAPVIPTAALEASLLGVPGSETTGQILLALFKHRSSPRGLVPAMKGNRPLEMWPSIARLQLCDHGKDMRTA